MDTLSSMAEIAAADSVVITFWLKAYQNTMMGGIWFILNAVNVSIVSIIRTTSTVTETNVSLCVRVQVCECVYYILDSMASLSG